MEKISRPIQLVSLPTSIKPAIMTFLILINFALLALRVISENESFTWVFWLAFALTFLIWGCHVLNEWERGVVLRLGKFSRVAGPGLIYIIPLLEGISIIDLRTNVLEMPGQNVITKDNVSVSIDGAIFFKSVSPKNSILNVQDYRYAMKTYAQTSLRDVAGAMTLDELLSERDKIQNDIREIVEKKATDWGLHVEDIRLQDISVPDDIRRIMSRQATAEREKRATITKSEGDLIAADNLKKAAVIMQETPVALQLRTLQTIDGLGPSPSNTVILFPAEMANMGQLLGQLGKKG